MKTNTIIWLVIAVGIIVLCVPIVRFVFVHLKEGYDQAERKAATHPAHADTSSSDTHSEPAKPQGVDFSKLDFSQNSADVHNRTDHFVENLPPLHGSGHFGSRTGMINQGSFEVLGSIASLTGASTTRVPSATHAGGLVTVELAVERGTVRAYLTGLNGHVQSGYVFADASPDHPARVTGYLNDWSDTGTPEQTFVLESRDGEAGGISYRVYRKG